MAPPALACLPPSQSTPHEEDLHKGIFFEVKMFETALAVLKKEKIIVDRDDPGAVSCYAQVMKTISARWIADMYQAIYLEVYEHMLLHPGLLQNGMKPANL
ncbi:unnamed protein product [Miscanthus lutarioriparius]|uniref:Uncharacterized protein n=1 Tax=Miscanthus lutarioriparius TaxID=422564 RepID=A0A811RJT3_9POAL|nr:unnamed protein product [Miscanthus lutarioriparius]